MCLPIILIVDDSPIFRTSLKDMLMTHFPFLEIEEAANGEEALLNIQELEPDLIFMDIKLPGRNGLELTRAIKATNSGIDIIILTSYEIPEYREAAFRCGASHFFTKGNDKSLDIAAAVASALALKSNECPTLPVN